VMLLSFMPCSDEGAGSKGKEFNAEITKGEAANGNHNDACSPFCQCSCCAGFSINHNITTFSSLEKISAHVYCSYLPENLIEISLPIWQPPQLV